MSVKPSWSLSTHSFSSPNLWSVASTRPWTRYEFADPALQALPAGQKIMLRVGRDHQLRLKAKLAEFRRALTGSGAPK